MDERTLYVFEVRYESGAVAYVAAETSEDASSDFAAEVDDEIVEVKRQGLLRMTVGSYLRAPVLMSRTPEWSAFENVIPGVAVDRLGPGLAKLRQDSNDNRDQGGPPA